MPKPISIEQLLKEAKTTTRQPAQQQTSPAKPNSNSKNQTAKPAVNQPETVDNKTIKAGSRRPRWLAQQGLTQEQINKFGPKTSWLPESTSQVLPKENFETETDESEDELPITAGLPAATDNFPARQKNAGARKAKPAEPPDIFADEQSGEKPTEAGSPQFDGEGGGKIPAPTYEIPKPETAAEKLAKAGKEGNGEEKAAKKLASEEGEETPPEEQKTKIKQPIRSLAQPEETGETGTGRDLRNGQNRDRNLQERKSREQQPADEEAPTGEAGAKPDAKGGGNKSLTDQISNFLGGGLGKITKAFTGKNKIIWWLGSTIVSGLWSCGVWLFSLILFLIVIVPSSGSGIVGFLEDFFTGSSILKYLRTVITPAKLAFWGTLLYQQGPTTVTINGVKYGISDGIPEQITSTGFSGVSYDFNPNTGQWSGGINIPVSRSENGQWYFTDDSNNRWYYNNRGAWTWITQ